MSVKSEATHRTIHQIRSNEKKGKKPAEQNGGVYGLKEAGSFDDSVLENTEHMFRFTINAPYSSDFTKNSGTRAGLSSTAPYQLDGTMAHSRTISNINIITTPDYAKQYTTRVHVGNSSSVSNKNSGHYKALENFNTVINSQDYMHIRR